MKAALINAVNICNALVATITRVTPANVHVSEEQLAPLITEIMGIVKQNT